MKLKAKLLSFLSPVYYLKRDLTAATRNQISIQVSNNEYWLDLGCGLKPYEAEFKKAQYIGIDLQHEGEISEFKKPDLFYDGIKIPFMDQTFHGVLCTEVLEHVPKPQELLEEINRVLVPGGKLIISVPFIYREHEEPYDFTRFTKFGLENILIANGFSVKDTKIINTDFELIAMLISGLIATNIGSRNRLFFYATSPIIFTILQSGRLLNKLIPIKTQIYACALTVGIKMNLKEKEAI